MKTMERVISDVLDACGEGEYSPAMFRARVRGKDMVEYIKVMCEFMKKLGYDVRKMEEAIF